MARKSAERAVELEPTNAKAQYALSRVYSYLGNAESFRRHAELALKLNPNDVSLLGRLGNYIAFSGDWDRGVALTKKAIALVPERYNRVWYWAEAKDYFQKKEFDKALASFKLSFAEDDWISHLQMAYTYGQLGELEKARSAVKMLLELEPDYTISDAVALYNRFLFEPSYIELMVEGLRKAGLPEGAPQT